MLQFVEADAFVRNLDDLVFTAFEDESIAEHFSLVFGLNRQGIRKVSRASG